MKAIGVREFGTCDDMEVLDLPLPELAEDDILIAIRAVGVNPADCDIHAGNLKQRFPHQFPVVPGCEASGVVYDVGESEKRFSVGDAVVAYSIKPVLQNGAYAQYMRVPQDYVARKPVNLNYQEAACIPFDGVLAFHALYHHAKLRKGERILIHTGETSVGMALGQLAAFKKADVSITCGHDCPQEESLLQRGISLVYNENRKELSDELFDVFVCCKSEPSALALAERVRPRGRIVSLVGLASRELEQLIDKKWIEYSHVTKAVPSEGELDIVSQFAEAGILKPQVHSTMPLEDAVAAHHVVRQGIPYGKVVLTVEQ